MRLSGLGESLLGFRFPSGNYLCEFPELRRPASTEFRSNPLLCADLSYALTELRALSGPAFVQLALVDALLGEARRFKRHALASLIERYRLALNVLL